LKGEVSEPVYPYPPLALKEAVVNALVHRDYSTDTPTTIAILPGRIEIRNPGGLAPEVLQKTRSSPLQDQIADGRRGIKGYRNTAIADLFYTADAMDKQDRGLAPFTTGSRRTAAP
jgi:predicted HTH transcriptional regulator